MYLFSPNDRCHNVWQDVASNVSDVEHTRQQSCQLQQLRHHSDGWHYACPCQSVAFCVSRTAYCGDGKDVSRAPQSSRQIPHHEVAHRRSVDALHWRTCHCVGVYVVNQRGRAVHYIQPPAKSQHYERQKSG